MNCKSILVAVGLAITFSGCGVAPESSGPFPEEQELIPVNEAPELQDKDKAQATGAQRPVESASGEALSFGAETIYSGELTFEGGKWGRSYEGVEGDWCWPGYVRASKHAEATGSGGGCSAHAWYTEDVRDCRVVVHIGVPPFKSGKCFWSVTGYKMQYFDYNASDTNSAQQNTFDRQVSLAAGQTITVATCGLPGVSASGDTYLRLFGIGGAPVAVNDDACSSLSSNLVYTASSTGTYTIKAGCFGSGSCSGRVGYTIQ